MILLISLEKSLGKSQRPLWIKLIELWIEKQTKIKQNNPELIMIKGIYKRKKKQTKKNNQTSCLMVKPWIFAL